MSKHETPSRASGGSMMDEEQIAQIEKLLERYKHGDNTPAREFQTFFGDKSKCLLGTPSIQFDGPPTSGR